jgi:DNA-binding response OmpR family regulator
MRNLHLLVYSQNYNLAENIKEILEKTGKYSIRIEKRLIENYAVDWDDSQTLMVTKTKNPCHKKTLSAKNRILFNDFVLDVNLRTLQWKDRESFHLTYKETKILRDLIENENKIVKRNFLLYNYWGEISCYKSRSLDVLISRLRKYLRLNPSIAIINYRNEGLRLICEH